MWKKTRNTQFTAVAWFGKFQNLILVMANVNFRKLLYGRYLKLRKERPSDRINVFVSKATPVETRVIL